MPKPYTTKRLLLTPQTWNVLLDVKDQFYPRAILIDGRMGSSSVSCKLTASECRHLSAFFAAQAKRLEKP